MIPKSSLEKVPKAGLTELPEGGIFNIMRKHWWAVTEDDCFLFYRGSSPQCNVNKQIVERISKSYTFPVKIEFIDVAYLEVNPSDY